MAKRALEEDGGHIHGNFHNYYTFRPPSDRLDMFPEGFFATLVRQSQLAAGLIREGEELLAPCILDIGCGEGKLAHHKVLLCHSCHETYDISQLGEAGDVQHSSR